MSFKNLNSEVFLSIFTKEITKYDVLIQMYIHEIKNPALNSEKDKALTEVAQEVGVQPDIQFMENMCIQLRHILFNKFERLVQLCKTRRWPPEYALVLVPAWLRSVEPKLRLLPRVIKATSCMEHTNTGECELTALLLRNAIAVTGAGGPMFDKAVVGDLSERLNMDAVVLLHLWSRTCLNTRRSLMVKTEAGPKLVIDWAVADFLLLHDETFKLVDEGTLSKSKQLPMLEELYKVVKAKGVEKAIRERNHSDLMEAWMNAFVSYPYSQGNTSLMYIQRRWYELKLLARTQVRPHWSGNRYIPGICSLLTAIVASFEYIVLEPFPLWSELVESGLVVQFKTDDVEPSRGAEAVREDGPVAFEAMFGASIVVSFPAYDATKEVTCGDDNYALSVDILNSIDPSRIKYSLVFDSDSEETIPENSPEHPTGDDGSVIKESKEPKDESSVDKSSNIAHEAAKMRDNSHDLEKDQVGGSNKDLKLDVTNGVALAKDAKFLMVATVPLVRCDRGPKPGVGPSMHERATRSQTRKKREGGKRPPEEPLPGPGPKRVLRRNRRLLGRCRPLAVRLVRLPPDAGRPVRKAKRVELPDIEQVRRVNSTMLTAEVAPVAGKPVNKKLRREQTALLDEGPQCQVRSGRGAKSSAGHKYPTLDEELGMLWSFIQEGDKSASEGDPASSSAMHKEPKNGVVCVIETPRTKPDAPTAGGEDLQGHAAPATGDNETGIQISDVRHVGTGPPKPTLHNNVPDSDEDGRSLVARRAKPRTARVARAPPKRPGLRAGPRGRRGGAEAPAGGEGAGGRLFASAYEEWLSMRNPALKYFQLPNVRPADVCRPHEPREARAASDDAARRATSARILSSPQIVKVFTHRGCTLPPAGRSAALTNPPGLARRGPAPPALVALASLDAHPGTPRLRVATLHATDDGYLLFLKPDQQDGGQDPMVQEKFADTESDTTTEPHTSVGQNTPQPPIDTDAPTADNSDSPPNDPLAASVVTPPASEPDGETDPLSFLQLPTKPNRTLKILRFDDSRPQYMLEGGLLVVTTGDVPCERPSYWSLAPTSHRIRILFPMELNGGCVYNPPAVRADEALASGLGPFACWLRSVIPDGREPPAPAPDGGGAGGSTAGLEPAPPLASRPAGIKVRSFARLREAEAVQTPTAAPERVCVRHLLYQKVGDAPLAYVQILTVVPDFVVAQSLLSAKEPLFLVTQSGKLLPMSDVMPTLREDYFVPLGGSSAGFGPKGLGPEVIVPTNVTQTSEQTDASESVGADRPISPSGPQLPKAEADSSDTATDPLISPQVLKAEDHSPCSAEPT